MNSARRRLSTIFCVGWPSLSSSQCLVGYSYGEYRIGCSKKGFDIWADNVMRRGGFIQWSPVIPEEKLRSHRWHGFSGILGLCSLEKRKQVAYQKSGGCRDSRSE